MCNTLQQNTEIVVEIQGHTDNVGKCVYNMKISRKRAESVMTYLVTKGIAASRITARGLDPTSQLHRIRQTKDGRRIGVSNSSGRNNASS
jgi:outer membrane protein OmpA-like peptidoglycan-associated protein